MGARGGRATAAAVALAILAAAAGGAAGPAGSAPSAGQSGGLPAEQPARGLHYDGLRPARADGPCHGEGFEFTAGGVTRCTHGPDPAPAGIDVRTHDAPFTADVAAAVPCIGTGTDGPRVQAIYAYPNTAVSRYATVKPQIQGWAAGVDQILIESSAETGGGQRFRWVTESTCEVDVDEVAVPPTAASTSPALTEAALQTLGYTDPNRKYLVFMDVNVLCGVGLTYTDDSASATNLNNGGPAAAPVPGMLARVDNACWNAEVAAHELMHTIGAVQPSAPHASLAGHCTDEYDVMCYQDHPATVLDLTACPIDHDDRLDCNHDDYYHTAPATGSYLATHWNTAQSRWLYATGTVGDVDPPGATVVPPTTLTDPIRVLFDETVRPVDEWNTTLRVAGAPTNLAPTRTCVNAASFATDCHTGDVRRADLAVPKLTSGQRYDVRLNPPTAWSLIADPSGNQLPALTSTFRASTSQQENSPGVTYGWPRVSTSSAYGGSFVKNDLSGASASYTFTRTAATSLRLYVTRGKSYGLADVYFDGVKLGTVNMYASSAVYKSAILALSSIPAGTHTLKIVAKGLKGSSAGTGTFVSVDAIKVGTALNTTPTLVQTWHRRTSASASGGAYSRDDNAGSSASFTFRGTGVSWVTVTSPGMGKANMYVDGVLKKSVDNYSSTGKFAVVRSITGLTDAVHTLKVTVTGTKRSAATAAYVAVDRFVAL